MHLYLCIYKKNNAQETHNLSYLQHRSCKNKIYLHKNSASTFRSAVGGGCSKGLSLIHLYHKTHSGRN